MPATGGGSLALRRAGTMVLSRRSAATSMNLCSQSQSQSQSQSRPPLAAAQQPSSSSSSSSRRRYHSYDHPPPPTTVGSVEEAILDAAYRHVPEHAFSARALRLGAHDAGFLDISPSILPGNGSEGGAAFALIRYHLVTQRRNLAAAAEDKLTAAADGRERERGRASSSFRQASSTDDRVAALMWARLLGNGHVIQHWQEALAVMAQPKHVPDSLEELARLADEICFLAGDAAVDPSWYTKRASLSMIYTAAELFMTNDASPGFVETRRFLARRLDEAQSVGAAVSAFGQWTGFTLRTAVNILRSQGVRI